MQLTDCVSQIQDCCLRRVRCTYPVLHVSHDRHHDDAHIMFPLFHAETVPVSAPYQVVRAVGDVLPGLDHGLRVCGQGLPPAAPTLGPNGADGL